MLTGLWNFLGPVLLIGAFYVLLGFAVRFLGTHRMPGRWSRPTLARAAAWMPDLPARPHGTAPSLVAGRRRRGRPAHSRSDMGSSVSGAGGGRLPVFLLALLDLNLRRREQAQARRELLTALRHPQPDAVAEALRQAAAAGLLADGLLAGQDWQRVRWADAQLAGADLHGSNLTDADLQNADLRGANRGGGVRWMAHSWAKPT